MATDKVLITPASYNLQVVVTKEELQYSTDRDLFNTIRNGIIRSAVETQTALLLNADTQATTAT
jgi:hypothetical protein